MINAAAAAPLEQIFESFRGQPRTPPDLGTSLVALLERLEGTDIKLTKGKETLYGKLRAVLSDQQGTWLLMLKCQARTNSSDFIKPTFVNIANVDFIALDSDPDTSLEIIENTINNLTPEGC